MDLSQRTSENVIFMVDAIKTKLRMASGAAMTGEHLDKELYEDLRDIYELVQSKEKFSVSEMDAIVLELGKLRKS